MSQPQRTHAQLHRYMEIERLRRTASELSPYRAPVELPTKAANQSPANIDDSLAVNIALIAFAVAVLVFAGPTIWHQFHDLLVAFGWAS